MAAHTPEFTVADILPPAQADALHERYRRGFVGRSRATRDLGALDALIAETTGLLPLLAQSAALRGQTEERLTLYRAEREAIATIQAGGANAVAAWRLAEWGWTAQQRLAIRMAQVWEKGHEGRTCSFYRTNPCQYL